MDRGSDKHGPRQDDELKHELEGMLRGNRPSRAEEWRNPEPPADDDPELQDPRAPEQGAGPNVGPSVGQDVDQNVDRDQERGSAR